MWCPHYGDTDCNSGTLSVWDRRSRKPIVATVIRQDGRWARLHNDAYFARTACANFAYDHGLDGPG